MTEPEGTGAAPPERLDGPLELSADAWPVRDVYHLLTSLVVPRPIAWVSTLGPGGVRNVAPHSYFTIASHDPPHVVFGSTGVRDTLTNIRATGEFVVNVVSADLVGAMNLTAADFPPGEDEFAWAGLAETPGVRVAVPRVARARAHLECRLVREVPVGGSVLVIGEVLHLHVAPEVWRAGRVDPELLAPVARLSGSAYAPLGEVFRLPRPDWEGLRNGDGSADGGGRAKEGGDP
ncbi:flavin reductase family protein [Streptomyces sp. NPDC056716]|uniref:flavin reductase family protein n=1 Tax=unclassified Streptomyces TaxID=2593676 RepID=UPI0036A4EDE6